MRSKAIIIAVIFLFAGQYSTAQKSREDFKVVDEYVQSLGALDTLNMGTISYVVTKKFPDAKDKVRAIFDWIAYNISFDLKGAKRNGNEKNNTDDIVKVRRATASGYAALFQDMCSAVKIRCLTVDGYLKNNVEQFTDKPDEFNHTWDVVQLGESSETWYYVDPTLGSGYTDDKLTTYTKAYNDAYFFADKVIFNQQHFPDNHAWLLGPAPRGGEKGFFDLPLVKSAAFEFGVSNFSPSTGLIKANLKKAVQFIMKVSPGAQIDIVALSIGEEKKKKTKTVDHSISGSSLSFSYKFDQEDSYPVTVLINNKPVLGYFVEVNE